MWGGLGEVAGQLGALADFVQLGGGVGCLGGCVGFAVAAVPVANKRDQVGIGECERACGGKCVEQFCEDVGEFVALLVEDLEQVLCLFVAPALQVAAESVGLAVQRVVGGQRPASGFGSNQVALDIDVADLAGSVAEALEQAESFARLLVVQGNAGEQGDQDELGLDAAGRGAEAMDGFGPRVGQAGEHCGLQRSRQFAECLQGMRRWSG